MVKSSDDTWYVAIMKMGGKYTSFIAACGEAYRNFDQIARRNGVEIVAQEFTISDKVIDYLGSSERKNQRDSSSRLALLADRLNSGEQIDPQEGLKNLVEAA